MEESQRMAAALAALSQSVQEQPVAEDAPQDIEIDVGGQEEQPQEEAPKQNETLTELYARLGERDKELVKLRQQLKLREKSTEPDWDSLKQMADSDPASVLEKLGLNLSHVFGETIQEKPEPDIHKTFEQLKAELQSYKEETNRLLQAQFQQQQMEKLGSYISVNSEKYPFLNLVKDDGGVAQAYELMVELYRKTGEAPSYDSFLGQLEEHVAGIAQSWQERYTKVKQPKQQKPAKTQSPVAEQPRPGLLDTPKPSALTEEERIRRALAAL